ncbi:MAG: phosphoribosylaminoimidazolesuccinocarboxamide synthase [Lachnospiraceae bacterium]
MEKIGLLYEGKAKKVFTTEDEDLLIVEYKDETDEKMSQGRTSGGSINNRMTNILCKLLEIKGVPTHYVQELSDTETVVKKVEIIPLGIVIRNIAAGSFSKKLGIEEGFTLLEPTQEIYYENEELNNPMINDSYATAIGVAKREEIERMKELAFKVNEILREKFQEIGICLVDFKLEFGRYKGQIILADQISPDTCHLWDLETGKKWVGDYNSKDCHAVYEEVLKRLR